MLMGIAQKCSACTRARPKGHGAPVQCTKGKCPKAFHVMCAVNGEESGTMFSVVKEVEKEVVIIEPSRAPPDYATMVMDIDGVPCMQPHPPLVESRVFKVIKKLEVQILCSQHNPVRFSIFLLVTSRIDFLARRLLPRRRPKRWRKSNKIYRPCLRIPGSGYVSLQECLKSR